MPPLSRFALPDIPATARLFSFTPLPWQELSIGLALLSFIVLDLARVWYHRRGALPRSITQ